LKELNISEVSKDIIEHLFHTADAGSDVSQEGLAGKLEWADSFYNYFFDHPTA